MTGRHKHVRLQRMKGSFTVEASLLVPFVTFILLAFLVLICFLHDQAVVQTYAIRTAQRAVSEDFMARKGRKGSSYLLSSGTSKAQLPGKTILADVKISQGGKSSFSIRKLYKSLTSRREADVSVNGSLSVLVPGIADFTGRSMGLSGTFAAQRIDYADDWFKTHAKKGR